MKLESSGFFFNVGNCFQLKDDNDKENRLRPVMHTFYEFAENERGMSKEGDVELLKLWESYWNEAG